MADQTRLVSRALGVRSVSRASSGKDYKRTLATRESASGIPEGASARPSSRICRSFGSLGGSACRRAAGAFLPAGSCENRLADYRVRSGTARVSPLRHTRVERVTSSSVSPADF